MKKGKYSFKTVSTQIRLNNEDINFAIEFWNIRLCTVVKI